MKGLVSKGIVKLTDPGNAASSPTGVTAEIELVDDGEALKLTGTAHGLTPGVPYASLIYDVASVAEGPTACLAAISDPSDPNFITPTMFVALWDVDESGGGTLSATNIGMTNDPSTRVYVPLSKIGTISIRDRTVDGPKGPGTGPAAVVACGKLVVRTA